MSETEIETAIRRYLLYKKSINNKENEQHIKDIQKQLINICEKFHFFVKKIKSNKNVNSRQIISEILNHLEFIYMKEDEIIWDFGDRVNEMYIIFLGEVNIYKKQKKKDDEEEPKLLYTLEKGYSIGEEYLKNNQIKRTYLTKAKTYCILGKLTSKEYNRILNKILYEDNILINTFLKELKIFNYDFIERFQKFTIIKYYNKNEYIFRQNDDFNTFYFILSGTVRLILNVNKSVKSKIDHNIIIGKNIQRFTTSRLFELKGVYKESINYNLLDLSYGDIIGGIEYYNHYNNYKYDVKCLNDVEILEIDLIHFNEILIDEEMKIFYQKIKNQTEILLNRIKEIKEGMQMIKFKDYIFSKNKFTKAFLINNPLSKKSESKTQLYINSGSHPFKIKQKYSKKKLKGTKLFLSSIEDYKNGKNSPNKNKKKIKDFFTNIDYDKPIVPVGQIFPYYCSLENIPSNNNKKVFTINSSDNNTIETSNKNINKMFKNKTISSSLSFQSKLKLKKKDNILNIKTKSYKTIYQKLINKKKSNTKIIFNNENIKEKIYFHFMNKNKPKCNKLISNINFIKFNKK